MMVTKVNKSKVFMIMLVSNIADGLDYIIRC